MNRITIGLLVAASVGALGWWTNQRSGRAQFGNSAFALDAGNADIDPGIIKTPKGNIDPGMIKTMPNVDPKMIVEPSALPKRDPNSAIDPPSTAARDSKIANNGQSGGIVADIQDQP